MKFNRRTLSLKWHLVLLVVGALVPVVLFGVAVVYRLSSQEQEVSERRVLLATRNFAETVEREVSGTTRTLQALAVSEQVDDKNLEAFYTELKRATQTQPTWLTVLLLSPDGQQLFSTRRPFGESPPIANEPTSLQRTVETLQPTVGDLALSEITQELAFPVRVPVIRDGELQYILTAVITPEALASTIEAQSPIEGEWTRTVVDSQGVVVVRTRNPERFVGQRGTPSFLKRIGESPEGVYRDTTLEGERVYVAFSRMKDLQWTAAVTVPVTVIQGPTQRAMWLVVGSGLALLLLSGAGAVYLSRRISRSIADAAAAAEVLARGGRPQMKPSFIAEVALLGESLDFSADLLSQRERERTEHLQRAEAARAEAEAASRLKDEFLITVSHELRTPLNAILGWATLLRSGRLDSNREQQAIATIERNAKIQAQLVEDLLDTSRIITGKLHLEAQQVDLTTVALDAVESIQHAADAKGIELKLHLGDISFVWGDPKRLQQVVWNLLSNAVKFTPSGGHVDLELQQMGSHVHLIVRDTGIGIRSTFLPHVFDRFRQADGSTTRTFGGLGLGLAIVRHLVELHGGTVQVDSPGEGQGATFTLRLPGADRPDPASTSPAAASRQLESQPFLPPDPYHHLQGIRVLVVDDEPDSRSLIRVMLTQWGASVETSGSAADAFQKLITWHPDVIVSDIGMPDEDGYDLIRKVRAWERPDGKTIPAIALTAFARAQDQADAIAAGYQIHLSKPVNPTQLAEAIASLVAPPT